VSLSSGWISGPAGSVHSWWLALDFSTAIGHKESPKPVIS
jgi:hypothetical protein